ncbi:MAG: YdcF family protein [Hydrogenovibrio sp.]|uniref:YdcF family protein n=1 Tax=Hydrogenovibrio sp. TaxID=2065821 RepID=UPI0028703A6C|nr:YdcF family protein [Hydrogenovibrio sp.]MDR9498159.1 YdcF family protein [Hydrogenovibrio sp.]
MDQSFFTLSKLAWILLTPGNLFVLLLALATLLLWLGKRGFAKTLLTLLSVSALTVFIYPVGDWLISPLEKRFERPATLPEDIDGIIILGGGEDLRVSLSWQTPQLGAGGDRYTDARYLAGQYPNTPVIFTGGSGSLQLQGTEGEGHFAKTLLTRLGLDPSRLIIESESRNTYENFVALRSTLPKPRGRYLLITSAFHMPRSVGIARQTGVKVVPWPTDYRSGQPPYRFADYQFNSHLSTLETGWREWLGLTAYALTGRSKSWFPAPDTTP